MGNYMRSLVQMDEKGRIQIPTKIRKRLNLKSKQIIFIEVKNSNLTIGRVKKLDESKDKVLRDILINPTHSKVKITTELLNKMREEVWTP